MNSTIVGLIIGIILVIVTIILIFWGREGEKARIDEAARVAEEVPMARVSRAAEPVAFAVKDDLTLIEGIGPKIAAILNQAGISSFAQLAGTDLSFLENLLKENGMQFIKPASWTEQARLAADGKMDDLKALQEKLVAGR